MIGQRSAESARGRGVRELDAVRLKGKREAIRVFEVLGEDDPDAAALAARSEEALAAYRGQRWAEARAGYASLADEGDEVAKVFLARIDAFEAAPPPPDWDGVYTMTTK